MGSTTIEWADYSWNPGIYGCEEISPACANCYAAKMAHRQVAMGNYPDGITAQRASGIHWSGVVKTLPRPSTEGLPSGRAAAMKRRPRVFVTSMADVFHRDVPSDFIDELFSIIRTRPDLSFLVLTKRPQRMAEWALASDHPWPGNAWAGTTVEDQQRADERIPHLLCVPALVRFLSMEPLLGPVDLSRYLGTCRCPVESMEGAGQHAPNCPATEPAPLHWVIAGGESGQRARPSHPNWFRSLRNQAAEHSVAFHFKQWGEWAPLNGGPGGDLDPNPARKPTGFFDYCERWNRSEDGNPFRQSMVRVGRRAAGRSLDGRIHDELPERAR